MKLIPSHSTTALGNQGRYFGGREPGIRMISGPPIRVQTFELDKDYPEWVEVDPRTIELDVYRLRRKLIRATRRKRTGDEKFNFENRMNRPLKRLQDLRWLAQMIGEDPFRQASKVPLAAGPFLLIWLSHHVPEFQQLFRRAPMLATLIARDRPANAAPWLAVFINAVRTEARSKRRDLLERHGFDPSLATAFAHITASACDPRLLSGLRETLADANARKRFCHLPAIGPDLIRLFSKSDWLRRFSDKFLHELAATDRRQRKPVTFRAIRTAMSFVELGCGDELPSRIYGSPAKLQSWYVQEAQSLTLYNADIVRRAAFVAAPIDEEPGVITQIRTGEQLLRQTVRLRQCLSSSMYVRRLCEGECYLFMAGGWGLDPCTIEVRPNRSEDRTPEDPDHEVVQVAGKFNTRVSSGTLDCIRCWAEARRVGWAVREEEVPECQLMLPGLGA